jgi:hypothetical protein
MERQGFAGDRFHMRRTAEDAAIMERLSRQYGMDSATVVRLAIRYLDTTGPMAEREETMATQRRRILSDEEEAEFAQHADLVNYDPDPDDLHARVVRAKNATIQEIAETGWFESPDPD